jgi:hypothetical protein
VFTTSPCANPCANVRLLPGIHDRLAGVDRSPHSKVEGRILLVQLADRVEHPEAGPHGALRVVAMRNRGAEDGHHRVANELLHHAAKRFDLRLHPSVIRDQHGPNILRVGLIRAQGEIDQVDKQHRDNLALFDGRLDSQSRAAGRTKPSPLRILAAASRTLGHEGQSTVGASLPGRGLASAERDRRGLQRV